MSGVCGSVVMRECKTWAVERDGVLGMVEVGDCVEAWVAPNEILAVKYARSDVSI